MTLKCDVKMTISTDVIAADGEPYLRLRMKRNPREIDNLLKEEIYFLQFFGF